jgi:hypothetical protein
MLWSPNYTWYPAPTKHYGSGTTPAVRVQVLECIIIIQTLMRNYIKVP